MLSGAALAAAQLLAGQAAWHGSSFKILPSANERTVQQAGVTMLGTTVSNVQSTVGRSGQNAALITSFLAAWHARDIPRILAHFYSDCEYFDQSFSGHFHGHKEFGDYLRYFFATIAAHQVTLLRTISDGDTIAFSWQCSGRRWSSPDRTRSCAFTFPGISLAKVRDGRILRLQDSWDVTSYLHQVGALD